MLNSLSTSTIRRLVNKTAPNRSVVQGAILAGVPIAWGRAERLRGLVENGAILGVEVEGERTTIRLST